MGRRHARQLSFLSLILLSTFLSPHYQACSRRSERCITEDLEESTVWSHKIKIYYTAITIVFSQFIPHHIVDASLGDTDIDPVVDAHTASQVSPLVDGKNDCHVCFCIIKKESVTCNAWQHYTLLLITQNNLVPSWISTNSMPADVHHTYTTASNWSNANQSYGIFHLLRSFLLPCQRSLATLHNYEI